jgi:hypothetical protein
VTLRAKLIVTLNHHQGKAGGKSNTSENVQSAGVVSLVPKVIPNGELLHPMMAKTPTKPLFI